MGQWLSDYEARLVSDPTQIDFQMTTGSGRYASSGRLSAFLGWRGPSVTVDTACSSSLVAVHMAVRSIQAGECEIALAGAANVILQPHISIAYSAESACWRPTAVASSAMRRGRRLCSQRGCGSSGP